MHEPPAPERPAVRGGDLVLFALYCALYAGFVGLSAFRGDLMATPVIGGVNLAVAYGVGLILAAIALAGLAMVWRSEAHEGGGAR